MRILGAVLWCGLAAVTMPSTFSAQSGSSQEARAEARRKSTRGPADSWTDRSLYDRCLTRGRREGEALVVETTNSASAASTRTPRRIG